MTIHIPAGKDVQMNHERLAELAQAVADRKAKPWELIESWLEDVAALQKKYWQAVAEYHETCTGSVAIIREENTARVRELEGALRTILGWREIDRNTLRERLTAIEDIAREALDEKS